MIRVTARDALQALKKFKRLAKQDLLASELTDAPHFWRQQAEARRATYDVLMELVENEGVEAAHRFAVDELAALPLFGSGDNGEDNPGSATQQGKQQALQLFVSLLGTEEEQAELLA